MMAVEFLDDMLVTDPSSSTSFQKDHGRKAPTELEKKASDRFYCPYEGCNRSFAELWRLKVHYRASPDVRGSGKERGHGAELEACPKCGAELKPGRHHVGCAAGKQTTAQQEKRRILKGKKRSDCTAANNQSSSLNSSTSLNEASTAIGVPISWLPLDFNQFFIPLPSEPSSVFMKQNRSFSEANSTMNLVYGNYGETPSMVTTQVGMDSNLDLDFSNFFKEEVQYLDSSSSQVTGNFPASGDGDLNLNQQQQQQQQQTTHLDTYAMPVQDSLFDGSEGFFNCSTDVEDRVLMYDNIDSRKRDRGPSMEHSELLCPKHPVSRHYFDDFDSLTNKPFSLLEEEEPWMFDHDLGSSSILWKNQSLQDLTDNNNNANNSQNNNGYSQFTTTSIIHPHANSKAPNQAMESLTLKEQVHPYLPKK